MESKQSVDVTKIIGHKFNPVTVDLTNKDAILYALSIGFQDDPLNREHFRFSYELDENFQAFPTHAVVLVHKSHD